MVRITRPLSIPGILFLLAVMAILLGYLAATGGSLAFAQAPAVGEKPKY